MRRTGRSRGTIQIGARPWIVLFTPEQPLLHRNQFTLTVRSGVRGVRGETGRVLPEDVRVTFSSAARKAAPRVVASFPSTDSRRLRLGR